MPWSNHEGRDFMFQVRKGAFSMLGLFKAMGLIEPGPDAFFGFKLQSSDV